MQSVYLISESWVQFRTALYQRMLPGSAFSICYNQKIYLMQWPTKSSRPNKNKTLWKPFFVFLWPRCIRQFLSFRPNGTANKKHWGFKRVASISKPHTYSTFLFWRTKENKIRLGLESLSSLTSFKMRLGPSGMRARAWLFCYAILFRHRP